MNLAEALRLRRVPFQQSTTDRNEIRLCCPFCVERGQAADTRFRLGVNLQTGQGHCFNCTWASKHGALAALSKKLDMGELTAAGAEKKSEPLPTPQLPEDFVTLWSVRNDSYMPFRQAWTYLRDRGVTDAQVQNKGLGVSLCGPYAYRIIFPVRYGQALMGIVARDFVGREPKYLNSPGEKALYNPPPQRKKGPCTWTSVLCEGVFDCLAIERVLARCTIDAHPSATLGHDLTLLQEERLLHYRGFVLWPDPDRVGLIGFIRIAEHLSQMSRNVYFVPPLFGVDVASLPMHQAAAAWAQREPWSERVGMRWRAKLAFV